MDLQTGHAGTTARRSDHFLLSPAYNKQRFNKSSSIPLEVDSVLPATEGRLLSTQAMSRSEKGSGTQPEDRKVKRKREQANDAVEAKSGPSEDKKSKEHKKRRTSVSSSRHSIFPFLLPQGILTSCCCWCSAVCFCRYVCLQLEETQRGKAEEQKGQRQSR